MSTISCLPVLLMPNSRHTTLPAQMRPTKGCVCVCHPHCWSDIHTCVHSSNIPSYTEALLCGPCMRGSTPQIPGCLQGKAEPPSALHSVGTKTAPLPPTCAYMTVALCPLTAGLSRLTTKPRHPGGHSSRARSTSRGGDWPVYSGERQGMKQMRHIMNKELNKGCVGQRVPGVALGERRQE